MRYRLIDQLQVYYQKESCDWFFYIHYCVFSTDFQSRVDRK